MLDFIQNYPILEVLGNFKPRIKPLIKSDDKTLNRSIIKEWFELGIWYNRLVAYRDSQKLELIENSLLLSTHLNNFNKNPQIMKVMSKLIESPWHLAFHLNFLYFKLEILQDTQKALEFQIQDPIVDLAINQTPNTFSFFIKSDTLQAIALQTEEFEPERYEIPFAIPTFEKNSKKKIFEDKGLIKNNVFFFYYNCKII